RNPIQRELARRRICSERQRKAEGRALAELALHPDPPAVHLDELAREREPKTRALGLAGIVAAHLAELIEDQCLVRNRDADPGIRDRDLYRVCQLFAVQLHSPSGWCELDRIGQQIE